MNKKKFAAQLVALAKTIVAEEEHPHQQHFRQTMEEHGIESPADLPTDEHKKDFFKDIKKGPKASMKANEQIASQLVAMAKDLVAAEEDAELEVEDEGFTQKLRDLRSGLLKISRKKNMRLQKFGVSMIRPNNKVSDLVDALLKVAQAQ
jgi:hypothetical protein